MRRLRPRRPVLCTESARFGRSKATYVLCAATVRNVRSVFIYIIMAARGIWIIGGPLKFYCYPKILLPVIDTRTENTSVTTILRVKLREVGNLSKLLRSRNEILPV